MRTRSCVQAKGEADVRVITTAIILALGVESGRDLCLFLISFLVILLQKLLAREGGSDIHEFCHGGNAIPINRHGCILVMSLDV